MTLDPLVWVYSGGSYSSDPVLINKTLVSDYTENGVNLHQKVKVSAFHSDGTGQFFTVGMEASIDVTSGSGFVERIKLGFTNYEPSRLNIDDPLVVQNVTVTEIRYPPEANPYYYMVGNDHSTQAYFNMRQTFWYLHNPNSIENNLTITSEMTYYNGTAYNQITQPFNLRTEV